MKHLKKVFLDICRGYSFFEDVQLFFKHPGIEVQTEADFVYERALETAVGNGLLKEEEILTEALRAGLWTKEKANSIKTLERDYKRIDQARYAPTSEGHMVAIRNELKLIEENWSRLNQEKAEFFENSAERFAQRASDDAVMINSFYRDRELKDRAFTLDDFDYLDAKFVIKLYAAFFKFKQEFSLENVKLIAISQFFMGRFNVSEDKFDFLGIPTYYLTNYQMQLIGQGRQFCTFLDGCGEIPDEYNDPEGITDLFFLRRSNAMKTVEEVAKEKAKWA